jgi:ribonuclease HI
MRYLRTYPVYFVKAILSINKVIIHSDGAARGNPGPAAIGATIHDEKGNLVAAISRCIGVTTNNQAEYLAVISALEKAISLGARQVVLLSDSELVIRQLQGRYRVKNAALKPLYQKVVQLLASLDKFSASSVPREQNAAADALANKALDSK